MTCDKNCNCTEEEEDDFEIQRLQDIITICEFLIKHKKNQKSRDTLDQLLDDLDIDKKSKDNDNDNNTTRVIYHPIYYPPWKNGSGSWTWNRRKYPWYDIWS